MPIAPDRVMDATLTFNWVLKSMRLLSSAVWTPANELRTRVIDKAHVSGTRTGRP